MKNEIKQIIEKQLTAEAGIVLKDVLQNGEDAVAKVIKLEKQAEADKTMRISLETELRGLKALNLRLQLIQAKEEEVTARETNYLNAILTIKLEEANKRAEMVVRYTEKLVRNKDFVKEIFSNKTPASYQDVNGNWVYPGMETISGTERIKTEETD